MYYKLLQLVQDKSVYLEEFARIYDWARRATCPRSRENA